MGSINVVGCKHDTIGVTVRGTFQRLGENHGKPTYKKTEKAAGEDVLIYFWDARDGEAFSGWRFGPKVGGDQVWAYHANKTSMVPPVTGWRVPFNGDIDSTMQLKTTPAGAAGGMLSPQKPGAPGMLTPGFGLRPGMTPGNNAQTIAQKQKEAQEARAAE